MSEDTGEKKPKYSYSEVYSALVESVKLQSHYAQLLNTWDGGRRIEFRDEIQWLERLRETGMVEEKKNEPTTRVRRWYSADGEDS